MAATPLAEGRAPTETIMLAAMVGRRELALSHEKPRILRVVETVTNADGATTDRIQQFLNLDQDAIIPLYAICGQPRTGYDVQVGYCAGVFPVIYPMRDRKEALRFQRFITGYRTLEHFDGVSCSIFFRGLLGVLWRDGNLQGKGELQFWRPTETEKPPALSPLTPEASTVTASSSSSRHRRRNSAIVVQSDHARNREVILSTPAPKPLLIFFLGNDSRYLMMRMDAIDLECQRRTGENVLDLSQRNSSTFPATSLSVARDRLSKWGLDTMVRGQKHPGLEELKCTNISLSFPNAAAMENFEKRLAFLRYQWHKAEVARKQLRSGVEAGKLPKTPDSRSRASTSSSSSLPVIPGLRLTTPAEWRQFEVEMQTRELDGLLPGIAEMPVGDHQSSLVAGALELPSPSQPHDEVLRAQFGETAGAGTAPPAVPPRGTGGREPPPVDVWPRRALRTGFIVVNPELSQGITS